MSNLDALYQDLVSPPQDLSALPGRKNITLRLSVPTHDKLDDIRALTDQSKTVMAEELLISAIEDVHQRMVNDARLDSWWRDRGEAQAEREEQLREDAEYQADQLHRQEIGVA
jgi:predicted transcriptional regulator